MSAGFFHLKLGNFDCIALRDGNFNYPLETFFANVPMRQLKDVLRQHNMPTTQIATPYTCLFVDTGAHKVLIDTGAGALDLAAAKAFPTVDHTTTVTGQLATNLAAAGIEPATVDTVIITHAHPDHIGGTLDVEGQPIFADADFFIAGREWAFWTSETAAQQTNPLFVDLALKNLLPIQDRLTLVEDGDEVVPSICVVATPGHTVGHIALDIQSAGQRLLHISDVVLHPLHLEHPGWLPVFDMLPEEAAISKQRTFDRAAEAGLLVFAHHFPPFPNFGHVSKAGEGWRWQPMAADLY